MKIITDYGTEYKVEHVKLADVGKDDLVILRAPTAVSESAWQRIHDHWEHIFPGISMMILEEGFDIEVLRRKADEQSKS